MRWSPAGIGVLALMALTGFPSGFGRNGRVDRAVHEDTLELVRRRCSPDEEKKFCGDGKEHSQECREKCGG